MLELAVIKRVGDTLRDAEAETLVDTLADKLPEVEGETLEDKLGNV